MVEVRIYYSPDLSKDSFIKLHHCWLIKLWPVTFQGANTKCATYIKLKLFFTSKLILAGVRLPRSKRLL